MPHHKYKADMAEHLYPHTHDYEPLRVWHIVWAGQDPAMPVIIYTKEYVPKSYGFERNGALLCNLWISSYGWSLSPCAPAGMTQRPQTKGRQYEECTEYVKHDQHQYRSIIDIIWKWHRRGDSNIIIIMSLTCIHRRSYPIIILVPYLCSYSYACPYSYPYT